jgi:hypothetical protein
MRTPGGKPGEAQNEVKLTLEHIAQGHSPDKSGGCERFSGPSISRSGSSSKKSRSDRTNWTIVALF